MTASSKDASLATASELLPSEAPLLHTILPSSPDLEIPDINLTSNVTDGELGAMDFSPVVGSIQFISDLAGSGDKPPVDSHLVIPQDPPSLVNLPASAITQEASEIILEPLLALEVPNLFCIQSVDDVYPTATPETLPPSDCESVGEDTYASLFGTEDLTEAVDNAEASGDTRESRPLSDLLLSSPLASSSPAPLFSSPPRSPLGSPLASSPPLRPVECEDKLSVKHLGPLDTQVTSSVPTKRPPERADTDATGISRGGKQAVSGGVVSCVRQEKLTLSRK